ncbi:MAG: HAD family phosphatase [Erysipelotrichia bacterium]|nr:HAD family phosphatase [Erysipelotrichia bacterium]
MNKYENKSKIRLISCDLDGTLFNRRSEISERNRSALAKARAKGIIVVLNSGRGMDSIETRISKDLYDYACCMNGQNIYCSHDNSHEYMPELDQKDLYRLYDIVIQHMAAMELYSNGSHVAICARKYAFWGKLYTWISWLRWRIVGYHPNQTKIITRPEEIPFCHIPKACFAGSTKSLMQIRENLPENLDSVFVNSNWLEVMCRGVTKGAALKKILEKEHLTKEQAAGFGDGENDISMLMECGTRIVMANAMENTKKIATDIALSNNEDGVGVFIEENFL